MLNYLLDTYLPYRAQFCAHLLQDRLNFSIVATSRVESAHRAIKRFLENRLANLEELYETIRNATLAQKADYDVKSARQRTSFNPKYKNSLMLQNLVYRVSFKALEQVWRQYWLGYVVWDRHQRNPRLPPLNAFAGHTGAFTAQWGLPCKHVFINLLQGSNGKDEPFIEGGEVTFLPFNSEVIHNHWWLRADGGTGITEPEEAGKLNFHCPAAPAFS